MQLRVSRFVAFLVMTSVLFLGLETAPLTYQRGINPRTCCGRPICQCTHKKGAFCPFKTSKLGKKPSEHQHHLSISQSGSPPMASPHRVCHLRKSNPQKVFQIQARLDNLHNKLTQKMPSFIKQAPCSSKKDNATDSPYSKEFYLFSTNHGPPSLDLENAFLFEAFVIFSLEDRRLDKPPQPILLPLAV